MTFDELGLSAPLLRAISAAGYSEPTPIQARAIPHVLAGKDLLACAQTGTGKTAAFALPTIQRLVASTHLRQSKGRHIRAIVLSPTRELALQITESFTTYAKGTALRVTTIVGGVSQNPQTRALKHGVDVVVATPGRLLDLIEQGYVDARALEILVLDEADRMLDMGFLPDVRRIIAKLPAQRQNLLFSATIPGDIRQLAASLLHDPARVHVTPVKETTDLVTQSVYAVAQRNKLALLTHLLQTQPVKRALVFTRTKHGADRVVRQLGQAKIRAEAIHGNKSQAARQRALENFKSNRTKIVVATDLAARGIDVEAVSHVFNYDMPEQPETYVHRIGRTGRAGASGIAISFCDNGERKYLIAVERLLKVKLRVAHDHPKYQAPAPEQAPPAAVEKPKEHAPRNAAAEQSGERRWRPKRKKPFTRGATASGSQPKRRRQRKGRRERAAAMTS